MLKRIKIIWKLGAVFVIVILVVLAAVSYINSRIEEHYAVSTARDVSDFYFESIQDGWTPRIMTHDISSIRELMRTLVEGVNN